MFTEKSIGRGYIHYRTEAEDRRTLVTKIYWLAEKGDILDQLDPVDQNPEPCRYISFQDDLSSGGFIGVFDIYLQKK